MTRSFHYSKKSQRRPNSALASDTRCKRKSKTACFLLWVSQTANPQSYVMLAPRTTWPSVTLSKDFSTTSRLVNPPRDPVVVVLPTKLTKILSNLLTSTPKKWSDKLVSKLNHPSSPREQISTPNQSHLTRRKTLPSRIFLIIPKNHHNLNPDSIVHLPNLTLKNPVPPLSVAPSPSAVCANHLSLDRVVHSRNTLTWQASKWECSKPRRSGIESSWPKSS